MVTPFRVGKGRVVLVKTGTLRLIPSGSTRKSGDRGKVRGMVVSCWGGILLGLREVDVKLDKGGSDRRSFWFFSWTNGSH